MPSRQTRQHPPAPLETKLNVWLNIAAIVVSLLATVGGGLVFLGSLTATIKDQVAGVGKDVDLKIQPVARAVSDVSQKVDMASQDAKSKVDALSNKVDANNVLTQTKQDQLSEALKTNQQDQAAFRDNVRTLFGKLSDQQQLLKDQIQQEKIDRLTDGVKKTK